MPLCLYGKGTIQKIDNMFSSLSKGVGAPGISVSETPCLEPVARYNWMVSILPFVLFCRLIFLLIGFKFLKTIWDSDGRNWLVIIWIIVYCCLKLPQNLRPSTVIIHDPVFFCGSVMEATTCHHFHSFLLPTEISPNSIWKGTPQGCELIQSLLETLKSIPGEEKRLTF